MAKQKSIRFDRELQLMAKRANQRLVELEHRSMKSPAYQNVQALLEMEGRPKGSGRGRRFSETGKGTINQINHLKKILNRFLGQQTSTIRGAKKHRKKVEESIERKYNLSSAGIPFDDFIRAMDRLSDSEANRLYGSDTVVNIIQTVHRKQNEGSLEQEFTSDEIIETIESSRNLKSALNALGLSFKDLDSEDLGSL